MHNDNAQRKEGHRRYASEKELSVCIWSIGLLFK